jgi:hypothetical protein
MKSLKNQAVPKFPTATNEIPTIRIQLIQEQISELVQPVLSEMREATSGPRQLDKLRKSLDAWQERKKKTQAREGQAIYQVTEGQAIY